MTYFSLMKWKHQLHAILIGLGTLLFLSNKILVDLFNCLFSEHMSRIG